MHSLQKNARRVFVAQSVWFLCLNGNLCPSPATHDLFIVVVCLCRGLSPAGSFVFWQTAADCRLDGPVWVFDVPHNAERPWTMPACTGIIQCNIYSLEWADKRLRALAFEHLFTSYSSALHQCPAKYLKRHLLNDTNKQADVFIWLHGRALWRNWTCRWEAYSMSNIRKLLSC